MTRLGIVDALAAFVLGLGVLGVAAAAAQGLVVDPVEFRASDIPQSATTFTVHIAGRAFVFLGIAESIPVLAILLVVTLAVRRRVEARGIRQAPDTAAHL